MSLFVVAHYADSDAYGGPEEGGWWYRTSELLDVVAGCKDEEEAFDLCRRLNESDSRQRNEHYEVVELGERRLKREYADQACHFDVDFAYDENGALLEAYAEYAWYVPDYLPEGRPHYC
jgi:hypothetical protein